MGLFLGICCATPGFDVANDGLTASMNMEAFYFLENERKS
jgi:hypothetical protein